MAGYLPSFGHGRHSTANVAETSASFTLELVITFIHRPGDRLKKQVMINAKIFRGLAFKDGYAQTYFGNYHVYFCRHRMEFVGEFINEFGLRTTVHTAAQLDGQGAAMQACQDHYERILFNMLTPPAQTALQCLIS